MEATINPRQQNVPLIIESHPTGFTGYPFVSLIQYRQEKILAIVDNINPSEVKAYALDLCGPAGVEEEIVITTAMDWYQLQRDNYPLSIEFARKGLVETVSKIYRSYATEFITRIIGPVPHFPMSDTISSKRKRKRSCPPQQSRRI